MILNGKEQLLRGKEPFNSRQQGRNPLTHPISISESTLLRPSQHDILQWNPAVILLDFSWDVSGDVTTVFEVSFGRRHEEQPNRRSPQDIPHQVPVAIMDFYQAPM